jgi:hypothetical protein
MFFVSRSGPFSAPAIKQNSRQSLIPVLRHRTASPSDLPCRAEEVPSGGFLIVDKSQEQHRLAVNKFETYSIVGSRRVSSNRVFLLGGLATIQQTPKGGPQCERSLETSSEPTFSSTLQIGCRIIRRCESLFRWLTGRRPVPSLAARKRFESEQLTVTDLAVFPRTITDGPT